MNNHDSDKATEASSVAFEWDLPERPDKVWRALTEADIVSEWLGPNDLRPEEGARFTVHDPRIGKAPVECEVLSVDPERSIVFGWRDAQARHDGLASTVTFEIGETAAGGTLLRIVHEVRQMADSAFTAAAALRPTTMAANDNNMSLGLAA